MAVELLFGEKVKGETNKAVVACNDYMGMGPGRSLTKLERKYGKPGVTEPPTKRLSTLETWSSKFGWVERAALYDADRERIKAEELEKQFREGLALDIYRVDVLKRLYKRLDQYIENGDLWIKNSKVIGKGEDAQIVEWLSYNSALLSDIRGVLDDIAKETGGRVRRQTIEDPDKFNFPAQGVIEKARKAADEFEDDADGE